MPSTRREFLKGLLGLSVVAVLPPVPGAAPEAALALDPFAVTAPEGITYQWVRTALLGEPDPENVRLRLANGWTFVAPATHPEAPTSKLGDAIENMGLVLMQRPTAEVEAQQKREYAANVGRAPLRVQLGRVPQADLSACLQHGDGLTAAADPFGEFWKREGGNA